MSVRLEHGGTGLEQRKSGLGTVLAELGSDRVPVVTGARSQRHLTVSTYMSVRLEHGGTRQEQCNVLFGTVVVTMGSNRARGTTGVTGA